MVQTSGSRLKPSDSPTSFICFSLFTGYPSGRESNTNYRCFALRSSLIKAPSTFQIFFIFTVLRIPVRSPLLQTAECSEYHPSALSPVVSAVSSTGFHLPGTNSSYLELTPCLCLHATCVCSFRSSLKTSFQKLFLQSNCRKVRALARVRVCVCAFEFLLLKNMYV